uniref:Protein FAM116Alike [Megachile rotundata] n=1 Tax=Lepeophtheirus salmonis TaxID=72036 RepID=A0A0K2TCP5_LEPSM
MEKKTISDNFSSSPQAKNPGGWQGFSSWVQGICVVTFDLELGQAIEHLYPPVLRLTEKDKINICYLAFPDSNSGVMGDSQFHFRIRTDGSRRKKPENEEQEKKDTSNLLPDQVSRLSLDNYNSKTPSGIQFDPNYLFGFVYFRQTKDPNIRRGYYQKSLILLSRLPLISFFSQVTNVLAKRYFESSGNLSTLDSACKDIDSWPSPIPGTSHNLLFMGLLFTSFLPSTSIRSSEFGTETVSVSSGDSSNPMLVPSSSFFVSPDLFTCLYPVVEHIDTLWELVLTGEPLVVMAGAPSLTSSAVQHLTSIIHPLAYCADYRPFYTIHDSDFRDITGSNSNALPNILLGVTNPFFSKALSHWPHIVKLGDGMPSSTCSSSPRHNVTHKQKKISKFKLDSKPGLYSQNRPLLEKDKATIKKIQKGIQMKRPGDVQSALLRRHFLGKLVI